MNETTVLNESLAGNMDKIRSEIDCAMKNDFDPALKKTLNNISNIIDQSSIIVKKIKEKADIIGIYEETLLQKKHDELLSKFSLTNKEKEIQCSICFH